MVQNLVPIIQPRVLPLLSYSTYSPNDSEGTHYYRLGSALLNKLSKARRTKHKILSLVLSDLESSSYFQGLSILHSLFQESLLQSVSHRSLIPTCQDAQTIPLGHMVRANKVQAKHATYKATWVFIFPVSLSYTLAVFHFLCDKLSHPTADRSTILCTLLCSKHHRHHPPQGQMKLLGPSSQSRL